MSTRSGDAEIRDVRYVGYSGERRGRLAGVLSLARWGGLRSLGARRGWKAKAVPIALALLAAAPAVIVLGVRALFADQTGIDLTDALPYAGYQAIIGIVILLFAAITSPELLCPDRRDGTLALYFSTAVSRREYLAGRVLGSVVPLLLVTLVPLLVLYAGILVFEEHPVGYLQDHWADLPRIFAAGADPGGLLRRRGPGRGLPHRPAGLRHRRLPAAAGGLDGAQRPALRGVPRHGRLRACSRSRSCRSTSRRTSSPTPGAHPDHRRLGARLRGGRRRGGDRPPAPIPLGDRRVSDALVFEGVSRWYGDTVALADVSFSLGPGVTGLLGHNGAGKSTALKLCAGFTGPSTGTVRVLGTDLAPAPRPTGASASPTTATRCGGS